MKSVREIINMLLLELSKNLNRVNLTQNLDYYNSLMGDTSFLLAGLLESELKANFDDWDSSKWIDDSLLTKVIKADKNTVLIWGIMIIGKENTTQQWTDPFYCEIVVKEDFSNFNKMLFLFGEQNTSEVTYHEFIQDRNMWDKGFYSNDSWLPSERNWKYTITL